MNSKTLPAISLSQAINLHQQGRLEEAQQMYLALLHSNPSWQIHYLLGMLYSQTNQSLTAIYHLEWCSAFNTDNPDWYNALAISYQNRHQYRCAKILILRAVKLRPDNPRYTNRYATLLLDMGDKKQCTEILSNFLSKHPAFFPMYITLANCWKALSKPHSAAQCLLRAYRQFPDQSEIMFNLADSLIAVNRYALAKKLLLELIENNFMPAESLSQLGIIQRCIGDFPAAFQYFQQAAKLAPTNPFIQWNLSLLLLLTGHYSQGWALYDSGISAQQRRMPTLDIPQWKGEDLRDKTLWVSNEQGLGDQIMLATHLDQVVSQAGKIVLSCHQRLVTLFQNSFPSVTVIDEKKMSATLLKQCDYLILAGSLYPIFIQQQRILNPKSRYLSANSLSNIDLAIDPQAINIGFAWKGGTTLRDRRNRCIGLHHWQPILATAGVSLHCLQHNLTQSELEIVSSFPRVHLDPIIIENRNFDYLASKLTHLKLVITVDNTIAHLCGALGIQCWCLIPYSPDWRWGLEGDLCPWYASLKLFRQRKRHSWDEPMHKIALELQQWLSHNTE